MNKKSDGIHVYTYSSIQCLICFDTQHCERALSRLQQQLLFLAKLPAEEQRITFSEPDPIVVSIWDASVAAAGRCTCPRRLQRLPTADCMLYLGSTNHLVACYVSKDPSLDN